MAKENLTKSANLGVTAREIDFVTRFANSWEALREILGIMRPVKKEPGAVIRKKKAQIVLQDGNVAEGEVIPYSQATVTEEPIAEMDLEKYAKGTSIEAIKDHGYDVAVGMTDDELLNQLQKKVMNEFYAFAATGELTSVQSDFQMALAMAKGLVTNQFRKMGKTATEVVALVNVLDVYKYIGAANVTVQSQFGFQYIKDFMGYRTILMCSDDEVERGTVIATPVENLVNYYVDPSTSDFAKAGLEFTTDGETNLIGFHTQGNYNTAVSECFAIMGLSVFAEYIDGVAVVKVETDGAIGSLTVASAAGSKSGQTKITVTGDEVVGAKYYFKSAGTAPSVTYLQELDKSWTQWDGKSEIAPTGTKITIAETNGAGQVVASGNATVTKA